MVSEINEMKKTVFVYSGEGTHSSDTQARLLKQSTHWPQIEEILNSSLNLDLEQLWDREIGKHRCPYSPLLTVVSQICLSDIWCRWGYRPDVTIGHSTGELAAAYQAGLYTLEQVLLLAFQIGEIGARLDGVMLHGRLTDSQIEDLPVNLSSYNFTVEDGRHVTVSGYAGEMDTFLLAHPDFARMQLPHPWHHPDYGRFADHLKRVPARTIAEGSFVSGVTAEFETSLKDDHWHKWLVNPIDFIQSAQALQERYDAHDLEIIEIGFHPILEQCFKHFRDHTYVSSMFRGEDDVSWILFQRRQLDPAPLIAQMEAASQAVKPQLDFGTSLAYQGLGSLELTQLSVELQPFFPTLAPHDFYRYKTVNQLIEEFGVVKKVKLTGGQAFRQNEVVVAGMSCRFPSTAETPAQFWDMLVSRMDQVKIEAGRGRSEAGFLNNSVTRFDHQYFNIAPAEAGTMDPQQILALELAEMLWRDAGIDPETLDKKRVGVYMGAWSQEYGGDSTSVYYPTGTNPSIIASRISYHYDLRGPSWVSNTACSSSLVAVHYAAKDIEAGRIDYAIAGGVNMLLNEEFTVNMRNSGFLSPDNRCKAFDNGANGYVRAEGGGLVLLVSKDLVENYYAEITGSAVNQNGRRSQVITAPHSEAQEELIITACQDAGIQPGDIDYVECHGTGTKIGDPIEITAIQNTMAKGRKAPLHIGSVKSNMGHLESAAGIAGLIKAIAILNYGTIPPNLHFNQPNQYINFESSHIKVVTEKTPIDHQAVIGVSSFGFGGTNSHIIIRGVEEAVRKPIQPQAIPFNREKATALAPYLRLEESENAEPAPAAGPHQDMPDVHHSIQALFHSLTSIEEIDLNLELVEQGLDSMSATELINQLEERFKIDIGPDILFDYPLFGQFVAEIEKRVAEQQDNTVPAIVSRNDINTLVGELFFHLTSIKVIDPEIELTDQGLDSMSGTEFISQLETMLKVDIGPEFLFEYPLRDQLVDELYARSGANLN
jgi:acyl transferase domain-containing protein/acyl carrier protein